MANRGGKGGSSDRFSLLGLENHCWWWLQPWNQKTFAPWQESYNKPRQCVEKQRHYSINKGLYSQGYGLPRDHVQLWELDCKEGRVPKNWCLQTVMLEKTPESPFNSKEIKPVIWRKINPEYSLEGLMLKLKLQYFGHERLIVLIWTADSLENSLMLQKIEGRRGCQRMRWLDDITNAVDINLGKLWEMVRNRKAWPAAVHSVTNSWTQLSKWSTLHIYTYICNMSGLDCKEIEPVNPKGNQSWILIGSTDAETEFQYFGHLMGRADSLEKTLMLGKIDGERRWGRG